MSGTLCIGSPACGIIADMTRAFTGLAAWLAGTALAVGLAWFGANMVVRDAGMSPGVPVINVAPAIPDRATADRPPARFARAPRFLRSGRVGQPGREPAGAERRDEQPVALDDRRRPLRPAPCGATRWPAGGWCWTSPVTRPRW